MNSDFPHPRLVRVRWINRRTRQVRAFVAANFAYDLEHARDIAEAILTCMVPCHTAINVLFETAILSRPATRDDAHSHETPWEKFYYERLNVVAELPKPKKQKKG